MSSEQNDGHAVAEPGESGEASIVLTRVPRPFQEARRKYSVRIDGKVVGKIGSGKTQRYSVQPGSHSVQLSIDLARSPVVTIHAHAGESTKLKCSAAGSPIAIVTLIQSLVRPTSLINLRLSSD